MRIKLWWIPPNCKGKRWKAHLYLSNWDVVNWPWSCHVLWWWYIHSWVRQSILGSTRGLCWGNGCWKHSGHQRVSSCTSPVMAHEEWFIGQPWGSGNFKGREGFAQQVERTFPYCLLEAQMLDSDPATHWVLKLSTVSCCSPGYVSYSTNLPLPPKLSLSYIAGELRYMEAQEILDN